MIKIVYFGTSQFSAHILEELIKYGRENKRWKIQTVITQSDKPVGRKKQLQSSEVSQLAEKYNITTLKPTKLNSQFVTDNSSKLECDLFIVASYGKIIPQSILDIPKLGSLNVHPSLLPKYRGASPIQTALLNGETETGISIMLMDAEMDHGPILKTKHISISQSDNYQTLSERLSQESASLLIETINQFLDKEVVPIEQDHSAATFTNILTKEDGYFDINQPPTQDILYRMIRAFYPWPGVWTRWSNKVVKFLPNKMIQMEGKKPMSIKEFLNGYPSFPIKEL